LLVSGQGLREGIAALQLGLTIGPPGAIRESALASLVSRFDGWEGQAAVRRRRVAAALFQALERRPEPGIGDALDRAARVLDIGTSLDFVDRHEHAADLFLTVELHGFTHRAIALVSAILRRAGDRHADPSALDPLLTAMDHGSIDRAAVLLALADEIERRCPRGRAITLSCEVGRTVTIAVPSLQAWRVKDLGQRFERAFGRRLVVRRGR
jgi:exopolyphosphatase/pppGpp-phosphohydrolase